MKDFTLQFQNKGKDILNLKTPKNQFNFVNAVCFLSCVILFSIFALPLPTLNNSLLAYVLLGWGIFTLLFSLPKLWLQRRICTPVFFSFTALFVWTGVSCVVNAPYMYGNNFMHWAILFLASLPTYAAVTILSKKELLKAFSFISGIVGTVIGVLSLWAVILSFNAICYSVPAFEDKTIGIANSHLHIFCHYNLTAQIILVGMAMCAYFILQNRGIISIPFYIIGVTEIMALSLTDSRTSLLCFCGLCAVSAFLLGWHKTKTKTSLGRILLGCGFAFLIFLVIYSGTKGLRNGILDFVSSQVISPQSTSSEQDFTSNADNLVTEENRELNNLANVKVRFTFWRDSLNYLSSDMKAIIFGVSPIQVYSLLREISADPSPPPHIHNNFIQIFTAIGLPGLLAFLAAFLSAVPAMARSLFAKESIKNPGIWIFTFVIILFALVSLQESLQFALENSPLYVFSYIALVAVVHPQLLKRK